MRAIKKFVARETSPVEGEFGRMEISDIFCESIPNLKSQAEMSNSHCSSHILNQCKIRVIYFPLQAKLCFKTQFVVVDPI